MIVLHHGHVGRLVMGVDPGRGGALAWVDIDTRALVAVADVPLAPLTIGDTQAVDPQTLADIRDALHIEALVIERAQAMTRPNQSAQGVSSMFNYGANWGSLRTGLGRDTRIIDVVATKWKRDLGLTSDKGEALALAARRWPKESALVLTRKRDDGRAEAALIADWAIDHKLGMFPAA